MERLGILTGADLFAQTLTFLQAHFGSYADYLYGAARGIDHRPVRVNRAAKSVGAERTFETNLSDREALREALENLSYRERRVLELRYGLGGEHPRTLDEVGRTFNVTRERIRQIEAKALRKLKHPSRSRKLRSFLET